MYKILKKGRPPVKPKAYGCQHSDIFIMFWMEEYHKMIHFIIINWFDWSGLWIWNRFRVKLKWKNWRVNLNITIINGMMIKYTNDCWNHRAGVGRRSHWFEVIFWRLAVTLSWRFIWFFNIEGVELINLSSKTWWEEFRATDDAAVILVSNPSTVFTNTLLYHA